MILNRLLRRLGLQRLPNTPLDWGRMATRSRFADLKKQVAQAQVIVDGGAAYGDMTKLFLDLYPNAIVHAIEPNPHFVQHLQKNFGQHPRVVIHAVALGSTNGTTPFNVLNKPDSSSILLPSDLNHRYHPNELATSQQINVPLCRLDDLIGDTIDIIKLDLQGYELEALKGSVRHLQKVRALTTEIEFVSLYQSQPLFGDIDVFLRQHGLNLHNLYELWTQPDGQLTAGDALYLRHL
jgi:FkbM family methyltransferase